MVRVAIQQGDKTVYFSGTVKNKVVTPQDTDNWMYATELTRDEAELVIVYYRRKTSYKAWEENA